MNLGNKLAVGEVVDHGADEIPAEVAPEIAIATVRAETLPAPEPVPAHVD
jgi:hypothetical protein